MMLLVASLAFAQGNAKESTQTAKTTEVSAATNQTFGQCVSVGAQGKNTCYSAAKDARAACETTAASSEERRTAKAACRNDYNNAMKQCKTAFKSAKKDCGKIKHNAWDSMKAAFA